jgi:hypothetical protein
MDITMNDKQRLQLQKMINENDVKDQTEIIRNLKHSTILANEINNMIMIKAKYRNDPEKIQMECMTECNFLYTYYTDIFNKVKKDEIDLNILNKFLNVLQKIEEGELNQHEGSFLVGNLLKELYIDSALKKADKLDKEYSDKEKVVNHEPMNVSWKQFKEISKKPKK